MGEKKEILKAYESILDQNFAQAIDWFEQAIAKDPDNAEYHYKLSITYARSDKLDKALFHARAAAGFANGNEKYLFHLQHITARDLVRQAELALRKRHDRHAEAIELLERATALDPLNVDGHLLLGAAYAALRRYDQAIRSLEEVIRLDPQHELGAKLLKEYNEQFK
ncbi:MAG TPA: tetratricopeptide repeat protein [Bacilli bacterium]